MWRLLAGLWRWWRADRIRVAPAEGRLLRLRPPCFLRMRGRTVEVLRRRVLGVAVGYYCRTADGPGSLVVHQSGELRWAEGEEVCTLGEQEVVVFELRGSHAE